MLERTRVQSPFYTDEHEAFRDVMRRFVAREIEPYAHEWDEAGEFPRELYRKASGIGLLGLGFPEEFGGVPADQFMKIVASQELARAGAGGVSSSRMSHTIGSPPIARAARPEVKARVLPQVLSGEKISALAITEPSGGSDVAKSGQKLVIRPYVHIPWDTKSGDVYRATAAHMLGVDAEAVTKDQRNLAKAIF